MPIPRKSVRATRAGDGDSSPGHLVINRKRQLFDWDHINLGANVDLTSSGSEFSDLSIDAERGEHELGPLSGKDSDVDAPTFEWVRNLVTLRRSKYQRGLMDEESLAVSKSWLQDQVRSLTDGSINVTLKCILAASGISRPFGKCRDEFKRPEYRSRYWNWSVNFILLIDYFIDKGNVNVTESSPSKYHSLLPFLNNCKNQQSIGHLSSQREQLLSAIGVKWDSEEESEQDPGESSGSSSGDSNADETWQMPTKAQGKMPTRPKRKVQTRRAQKRRRAAAAEREMLRSRRKARTPSPLPVPRPRQATRPPPVPTLLSLQDWGRTMFELRHHYKKLKDSDELYNVPHDQLALKIWMNTEVARCATGVLIHTCRGVLYAAGLLEPLDVADLSQSCLEWGRGFVSYVDYMIGRESISDELASFMYSCRSSVLMGKLRKERDALLQGVNEDWLDCQDMREFMVNTEKPRNDRAPKGKRKRAAGKGGGYSYRPGEVVEVLLDSGTYNDERSARKKRKQSTTLVRKMLSSMIKGEVAVQVEGRTPTAAERDAKEWVLRARAKDFDLYGRQWFRQAVAE